MSHWPDLDRRAGDGEDAVVSGAGEAVEERALVAEDRRLVAVDEVEVEQVGVEEARGPGAGHDGPGVDGLDVAHRPGQLAVDLGPHQGLQLAGGQLVDHRVPDGPAVLQPVEVDGTVAARASRSVVRQSFWSTMRTSPSLTTSAESPPGPSVMLVSTWMATLSPPRSSSSRRRCGSGW